MDPFTHALLGASVQEVGLRQKIGRDAAVAGMLAGILPDGDIVMLRFGKFFWADPQIALILGHRGVTHSIAAVVILPLLAAAVWWLIRTKVFHRKIPAACQPVSFGWLYLCCLAAVVAHVLLDACTSYGTMLYWPFSTYRIAWDCVAIIDPLFTLIPAAVLVICGLIRRKNGEFSAASVSRTKKTGRWGLVFCVWYLLFGVALHYSVIERSLPAQNRADVIQAGAFPVVPSLCEWRVVWETPDGWHVGKVNAFSSKQAKFNYVPRRHATQIDAARKTKFYKTFCGFTGRMLRADVKKRGEMTDVYFHDMRYGFPPDSPEGLWAYRFEYDGNGRLVSHGRVYPAGRRGLLHRIKESFKK
ncbi:MAG TPA: metal-dependent hydrolase [Phycisphaerae bacterium]|nr:metal-dependent hydrolase [Phycisphaerae bacterium]HPS52904.1 metal-dependent hydrolase [Phycisphaerae bacterium]